MSDVTTELEYGKSVKIADSDGSISWKNGDIEMVDGFDNVAQRISYSLTVQYGEDQFNPEYGLDRFAILGSDLDFDDQVEVLKAQVIRTILEDDQVVDVPEIEEEESDYARRAYDFVIKVEIAGAKSFIVNLTGVPI